MTTWRWRPANEAGPVILGLILLVLGLFFAAATAPDGPVVAMLTVAPLAILGGWFVAHGLRCAIGVDGTDLVVRNTVRTYRIPLGDVLDCVPDLWGIKIKRRSGRTVRATAVALNRYSFLSRYPYADRVADEILDLATAATTSRGSAPPRP